MNNKKIQPAVVIGLGGSGVKAITFLKKTLLAQAPDVMQFVRFLAIDIDELKGDVAGEGLFDESVRLDPLKNEFLRINDQTRESEAKNIPSIAKWCPDDAYRYLPLTEGARQSKPIGRMGFFLAHSDIAWRLHQLTDRLVTPEVLQEFPRLQPDFVSIYVISSLCGGTGAGLFVDIAYELRYLQRQAQLPEKTRIKGLFALGNVYNFAGNRVLANTYASLRELNWIQREEATFHPIYPDGTRDVIQGPAYDAIYLFGNSNDRNIQFSEPENFAQLCAEFIFLDSGADTQENGDSLSAMIQSSRNNAEVYTKNYDADGTPRYYSALGLCKIRFPAEQVAQLCAVRFVAEIIEHHFMGQGEPSEPGETKRKAQEFVTNEKFLYHENVSDLADRLLPGNEPLDLWVTNNLTKAHGSDVQKIKTLEAGRFNTIIQAIEKQLKQTQTDMPMQVVAVLQVFDKKLQQALEIMQQENRGLHFMVNFLKEMQEILVASRDFAQQRKKDTVSQEKSLSAKMGHDITEMGKLLNGWSIFNREARLEQLKNTYRAIRQHFLNRIEGLKMQAILSFYDGVYDAKQNLLEGGTGALSILITRYDSLQRLQENAAKRANSFREVYQNKRKITGSPFEILIYYDNEQFSTLDEIYNAVVTPGFRKKWSDEMLFDDTDDKLLEKCTGLFREEIDKKTVAQRIYDAKRHPTNPIDYYSRLRTAYDLAHYFCRLDKGIGRFAGLRDSEQSVVCVVGFKDESDPAWGEVSTTLKEAMSVAGNQKPFSHTVDRHNILIYREFCGFPAYTLQRMGDYHNNYNVEAGIEGTPPLQMLILEPLVHIQKPVSEVLSKFKVLTIEALALGVIVSGVFNFQDGAKEGYGLVTAEEWKRRKLAEEAQTRGEFAAATDRTAGSQRIMGAKLEQVVSLMKDKVREEARLSNQEPFWKEQVQQQIKRMKEQLKNQPELLQDLFEALYYEGYIGVAGDLIDRDTAIRPAIEFILNRDFALNKEHIYRPEKTHQEMLRSIYIPEG